jgi:hypothetical protein
MLIFWVGQVTVIAGVLFAWGSRLGDLQHDRWPHQREHRHRLVCSTTGCVASPTLQSPPRVGVDELRELRTN